MNRSTRRQFLKSSGAVIATAIFPAWGCDGNEVRFKSMPTGPDMDVMDMDMEEMSVEEMADMLPLPPITSNERHYLQSIKGKNYDPKIAANSWRLAVDGLVDQPLTGLDVRGYYRAAHAAAGLDHAVHWQLDWRAIGGQCRVGRHAAVQRARHGRDQERGDPSQVLQRQL